MNKTPIFLAGLVLAAFSVAGVGLVAVTQAVTSETIAANERQAMIDKFSAILPKDQVSGEPLMDNDPLLDRITTADPDLLGAPETKVYRVRYKGEPAALVLNPVVPNGYAGPIQLLVAVGYDGRLGGVRVIAHSETPGLGDKIERRKSSWVDDAFVGKALGEPPKERWKVKRDGGDFDQFTGATITPRAVVAAVRNTLIYVKSQGDRLYNEPSETGASGDNKATKEAG